MNRNSFPPPSGRLPPPPYPRPHAKSDRLLVSPAPANFANGWLGYFYNQATNLGYRVDYTAVHQYPGPSGGSSASLISTLQTAYTSWGRPVWLTEFSFVDWAGNQSWTEEDNYNCLAEFLWRAESLPWLRRYGLFIFTAATNYPMAPNPWTATTPAPRSNSFDTNGNMTPFGQLYAAWDGDANVETNKAYFIHNNGNRKRMQNTLDVTPNAIDIRSNDVSVQWVLTPAASAGQYYLVSQLDGRRLSFVNGGSVSLVAPGTTGTAVQWGMTQYQYGWYYLEHPATGKRLQLQYNNSTLTATFSMATNTTTGTAVQWRFIVPLAPADVSVPAAPTGLTTTGGVNQVTLNWDASLAADFFNYSIYRSPVSGTGYSLLATNVTTTNYLDSSAAGGATYYYVVTATDWMGRESAYSAPAYATSTLPLPTTPTNLLFSVSNNNLVLNWPSDYTGWLLQVQTNSLAGVWFDVPGSTATNLMLMPIDPASPGVFFRLIYP